MEREGIDGILWAQLLEGDRILHRGVSDQSHGPGLTMNLADSYIEQGGYQQAMDLYKSVKDGTDDWRYSMGRAHLFNGDYPEAIKNLQSVGTSFKNGRARVLEAAALIGLASAELDQAKKAELQGRAHAKLSEGVRVVSKYWDGILTGRERDQHEGFEKAKEVLRELYPRVVNAA